MIVIPFAGKKAAVGRNRSHAQNRTPRKFGLNLQKATFFLNGEKISGLFLAKSLKRLRKEAGDKITYKKPNKKAAK